MKNIIFTSDQEQLFKDALDLYGIDNQLRQTNEECTELSLAILKLQRAKNSHHNHLDHNHFDEIYKKEEEMMSEIADVIVMINQLLLVYNPEQIQQFINAKLRRQRKRIDKELEQLSISQSIK